LVSLLAGFAVLCLAMVLDLVFDLLDPDEKMEALFPLGMATGFMLLSFLLVRRNLWAARELDHRETFRKNLEEGSMEGVLIHRMGKLLYVSRHLVEMLGYRDEAEVLKLDSMFSFVAPHERERLAAIAAARARGEDAPTRLDTECIRKDGTPVWVDIKTHPVLWDGQPAVQVSGVDITLRKKAEQELKESEERYRILLDSSVLGIMVHRNFKPLYANPALVKMVGVGSAEELLAMDDVSVFIHPKDRARLADYTKARLEGKPVPSHYEYQGSTRDGTPRWLAVTANSLTWGGEPAVLGTFSDITERKQAEDELRRSEEKYSRMAQNVPGWLFQFVRVADEERFCLAEIKGRKLETVNLDIEACKKDAERLLDILHPDDGQKLIRLVKESARGMHPIHWIGRYYTITGEERWTQLSSRPHQDEKGQVVWDGMLLDITHSKRMEEEGIRAQKLESVSVVAGGIAHDFNNILTALGGNITLARMEAEDINAPGLAEILGEAENACLQAKGLTSQLLTFTKGGAPIRELALLPELIRESVTFTLRGTGTTPVLDIPENLSPVQVDKGQITQMLHNLAINASQSMPNGGRLWITAKNEMISDQSKVGELTPGEYVTLSLKDEGQGMAPAVLERIFDPYFTTKSAGNGLGLTITFSIVKKHDGWITVESKPGGGTRFQVYLPAAKNKPDEWIAGEDNPAPGGGRLLIMDDDRQILDVLEKLLGRMGYEVSTALEGRTALDLYKQGRAEGKPFDAVLMDLTIRGGMNGKDTIIKLLEYDAGAKAIVYSGYPDDPVLANFRDYGFVGVVAKPFHIHSLETVLANVIRDQSRR